MKLYEIDQAIESLVDQETGEIQDWSAFEQLQMERDQKIENIACWYKNLLAEAKAIRQEELALEARRHGLEAMAEKRKMWLRDALCGQKFETAKCVVSFRKTTSVNVTDASAVAKWAEESGNADLVTYAAPKISKNDLAKLLKDNVEVPGAELVSGLSMGVK